MEVRIVLIPDGVELRYKTFDFNQLLHMSAMDAGIAVQEALRELWANVPVQHPDKDKQEEYWHQAPATIQQTERVYRTAWQTAQQAAANRPAAQQPRINTYAGPWRWISPQEMVGTYATNSTQQAEIEWVPEMCNPEPQTTPPPLPLTFESLPPAPPPPTVLPTDPNEPPW